MDRRLGPGQQVGLAFVRFYQLALSPFFGGSCRFEPTCSAYAAGAIREHGAFRGSLLAARRLAKCHPFGGSGWDPVPERQSPRTH